MHAPSFDTDLAQVLEADPLTRPIVDAIAAGRALPEAFLILDTYHEIGEPVSANRCELIRDQVHETMNFFGLTMPITYTMLDRRPAR
jgi:hypothetical protein